MTDDWSRFSPGDKIIRDISSWTYSRMLYKVVGLVIAVAYAAKVQFGLVAATLLKQQCRTL